MALPSVTETLDMTNVDETTTARQPTEEEEGMFMEMLGKYAVMQGMKVISKMIADMKEQLEEEDETEAS